MLTLSVLTQSESTEFQLTKRTEIRQKTVSSVGRYSRYLHVLCLISQFSPFIVTVMVK